jgi:hypothetical protein
MQTPRQRAAQRFGAAASGVQLPTDAASPSRASSFRMFRLHPVPAILAAVRAMLIPKAWLRATIIGAAVCTAVAVGESRAANAEKLVPDKTVHFANSDWSAVPEIGPDKKVRQCVLAAKRSRAGPDGPIDTALSIIISRGSGLAFAVTDGKMPPDKILDDQAEIALDDRSFPATAFTVGSDTLALHPGDAAVALAALEKTAKLRLRSDGAGIDSGAIALNLPGEAFGWLKQCDKQFDIAIDRPTDPNAGPLPVPRPRSPEIGSAQPTAAGPSGIDDKQKISGWDASELRDFAGKIAVCFIRQHYAMGSGSRARVIGTYLMVSRAKGLTIMLKDSTLKLPEGKPVEATLKIENKPFVDFSAHVLGSDEIGIFPGHGTALALALGDGVPVTFDAQKIETLEFPVPSGIVPWLRACARRNGMAFEP